MDTISVRVWQSFFFLLRDPFLKSHKRLQVLGTAFKIPPYYLEVSFLLTQHIYKNYIQRFSTRKHRSYELQRSRSPCEIPQMRNPMIESTPWTGSTLQARLERETAQRSVAAQQLTIASSRFHCSLKAVVSIQTVTIQLDSRSQSDTALNSLSVQAISICLIMILVINCVSYLITNTTRLCNNSSCSRIVLKMLYLQTYGMFKTI